MMNDENKTGKVDNRIRNLIEAFKQDGYTVDENTGIFYYNTVEPGSEKIAIRAESIAAAIGTTGKKKRVFYLEGTPKQMGYMMGRLAEDDVTTMSCEYVENFVWAFIKFGMEKHSYPHGKGLNMLLRLVLKVIIGIKKTVWWVVRKICPPCRKLEDAIQWLFKKLGTIVDNVVVDILFLFSKGEKQDIPTEYLDEINGIYEGCKAVNPGTKVKLKNLFVLNAGIDAVLAYMYRGLDLVNENADISPGLFNIPLMCNGFSIANEAAAGRGHLFGRDFMFPTANAFQYAACMTIYKPDIPGKNALPFVCVGAPGMVGIIAGVNRSGLGVGVDISPSSWANPKRIGFNSLMLCRQAIQYGSDIDGGLREIREAPRGVSWNYILADGSTGKACIAEACMAMQSPSDSLSDDFSVTAAAEKTLQIVGEEKITGFRDRVRDALALINEKFPDLEKNVCDSSGLRVRWATDIYTKEYLDSNGQLFDIFNKKLYAEAMGKHGFIDKYNKKVDIEQNTPFTFYFAPQREENPNIVLTTNMFIDPSMRWTVMTPWLALLFKEKTDDFQWRYDTLNNLILEALEDPRYKEGITYEKAKELIDFLNPNGKYPWYYGRKAKVIEGSVSIFDLKACTIESHYGFYRDRWIKLSLMNYLD